MTTKADIRRWLVKGKDDGYSHLLVMCDTFDYSDYPFGVCGADEARARCDSPGDMQKVMEVYDLAMDWEEQLNERRAFHL